MKEVNINIEGYNVNGICVGCLNYNRRMFYHPTVKECFRLLGNIDVPDGLEVQVCWECLARVNAAINFKQQILKSYDFLISYSKEHTFLDSPNDFHHHATTNIERTEVECYECVPEADVVEDSEIETEVKEEEEIEDNKYGLGVAIKEDTFDDLYFQDVPADDNYITSDEDVQLSKLKDKETEKGKKKRKSEKKKERERDRHTFLDSPNDFHHHATTNIERTEVECYECVPEADVVEDSEIETEVKEEEEIEDNKYGLGVAIKEETKLKDKETEKGKKKRKSEKKKERERDRVDSPKRQKTKKEKNSDKKSRKLKNLPEELVELYTMSKEEMWAIRIEDLNSKEFQKLKYRCDDCIIAFNTEKLMHDHLNGKHQPKSEDCHQCSICQAYFLTKDNVAAHKALHQQGYKCRECGFNTTLKRRMLKHVGSHAPSGDAHVCQTCGSSFSTKSKLTYHRGVCCQERPQCDCCGKVFANKMTLKYHLKILPQNKDNKPKEKLFIPCKGCDKVFHSKKSYRAHVVIHDGLTYPCPICGKLFQWKRNLARHLRNHRERQAGNLHECRACSKTFASRDCYNNHMRLSKKHVSQDTFPHECNYCGKKFATKWCLTDHIDWDHLKKIKYQCSFCFKAFKTAKILVAHVNNIHEGKKKEAEGEHLCEICGKSYRTVKRLKGHVWAMHTKRSSSKIYKCKLCPATFMWQTSIYKHMKMMHDNNKKSKTPRAVQPVKKEESYPGIELANRMQYFQQNIGGNLNIVHIQPLGMTQNIV